MSVKPYPLVSIILPAKNEELYLDEVLKALLNQDYPSNKFEIILVDNKSTDRTREIALSYNVNVIYYDGGPVGAVRNHGVCKSSGDILFFLDSDCVVPKNWLANAVNKLIRNKELVLGGGNYLRDKPYFLERHWLLPSRYNVTLPKYLLGGCIALHRDAFLDVGMFSEVLTSGEDTKLSQTLVASGYTIRMTNEMSVIHMGNAITIKDFFSRQVWHSENYFQDMEASFKDPTFFLIIIFALLVVSFLLSAILGNIPFTISLMILSLTIPAVLSVKRIIRSGQKNNFKNFPFIYCLDTLYVIGRSAGILKSLSRKLLHKDG